MKKLDHNAKERVRRLKLTESYLALRSLLPDHPHKSKKKWSAPCIIDRALEYIPELEASIQKLTSKKNDMITVIEKNEQRIHDIKDTTTSTENQTLTVSVNEVKRGEVIIQICMQRNREKDDVFSNLIDKLDGQGLQLRGASSLIACEDRCCYHLHLEMDESKLATDYIASLKDKAPISSNAIPRAMEALLHAGPACMHRKTSSLDFIFKFKFKDTCNSSIHRLNKFKLHHHHQLSVSTGAAHQFTLRLSSCFSVAAAADASSFDPSPPPIDHDFLDTVALSGAVISDNGVIETFKNDEEALSAAENGVVAVDLSHWGRIRVSGEDRIKFLHNQSTANFECLHAGQGCDTVFVTPIARTIDIANAWMMKNAILLVVSPVTCKSIKEMLLKYIFLNDKVEIEDISSQTSLLVLVGPESSKVMETLGVGGLVGQPYGTHQHFSVNGMPVTVGVGNIISEEGYSMLMSTAAAGFVWKALIDLGAIPMGSHAWERLRVYQGRPEPGKELTSEFNVLEAGLWNSISINKGCYKGQETISRLITYDGVKQKLWGIMLSAPAEPGSPIVVDGKKVGKLTSYALGRKEAEHVGLGYVKRRAASRGDKVIIGDNIVGTLVDVPYLAQQSMPLKSQTQ